MAKKEKENKQPDKNENDQESNHNYFELLSKLASNLNTLQNRVKDLETQSDLSNEEFLQLFNNSLDEISNIIYNRLINSIYDDPKFKDLILSLIKIQFTKLSE